MKQESSHEATGSSNSQGDRSAREKKGKTGGSVAKLFFGVPAAQIHTLIPGLAVAALLALATTFLARFIGEDLMGFQKSPVSPVMLAIILGLIIGNLLPFQSLLKPGITFAVKKVLRLGIILLGIRLSIIEVFSLGAMGIPIVLICIAGALLFTSLLNRWMGLSKRLGTLIAVGTSICGVSAIVATAPAIDAKDEEVAYAVAVITIFGILATLTYPYLAHLLFAADPVRVGLFLGTSVHDTSQVTGSGIVYADTFSQPHALNVATVTKLVRNVFMAAVIPLMAYMYGKQRESGGETGFRLTRVFPLFIVGFLVMAVIRSVGDATATGGAAFGILNPDRWSEVYGFIKTWAVHLLVVALAGVGLSIRFKMFKHLGLKPFLVGLGASVSVGVFSFAAISLLGRFLTL